MMTSTIQHHILVADDEYDLTDSLELLLTSRIPNCRVSKAGNGREALDIHSKDTADVILSDLVMPMIGGQEFLRNLRERSDDVPFIIMTGNGTLDNAAEAVRLGAIDFILKPFEFDKVLDAVRHGLEMNRLLKLAEADVWQLISDGKLPKGLPMKSMMAAKHVSYLRHLRKNGV